MDFPQATGRGKAQDAKERFEPVFSDRHAWESTTEFKALRRVYSHTSSEGWRRPNSALD